MHAWWNSGIIYTDAGCVVANYLVDVSMGALAPSLVRFGEVLRQLMMHKEKLLAALDKDFMAELQNFAKGDMKRVAQMAVDVDKARDAYVSSEAKYMHHRRTKESSGAFGLSSKKGNAGPTRK